MEHHLSVNETLARVAERDGQDISLGSILSFVPEEVCISHFPATERHEGYRSSISLSAGCGALGFDREYAAA